MMRAGDKAEPEGSAETGTSRDQSQLSSKLPKTAILIGLVSLLSDTSSELVYPLLPVLVTQILSAPAAALGLIEGVATGTASIVSGVSGWISDRVGRRKPIAFFGYFLTSASRPVISLALSWPVVMAARFADRLGKGIRTAPRDALVAESAPSELRGRVFGFERAMDSAGAVIGPLLAVALVGWAQIDVRTIFLISAIPAFAGTVLILFVRDSRPDRERDGPPGVWVIRLASGDYKRLMVVIAVFGLANSANAFLIMRSQQLGLGTQGAVLAYAVFNAVSAGASMPAGSASDRFGRRDLLVTGYLIYAISYAGFGFAKEAWLVWPLFAFYGLFPALTDGVAKAMAVDTAGSAGKATAIGIYSMVVGLTQIGASYLGGLVWDLYGSSMTFYLGAFMASVAAGLLIVLFPRQRMKTGSPG